MDQQTQYATTLLMTGAGAVLATVYDIYRSSLEEWRFLRRFAPFFDFGFWVFALIFVFTLLLGVNDGDVRIVVFVLLGIGALIYWKTAHPLVAASTRLIVRFICRVFAFARRVVTVLLVGPVVYLLRGVRRLVHLMDGALVQLEPAISWPVVWLSRGATTASRAVAKKYVAPLAHRGKERVRAASNRYRHKLSAWLRRGENDDET